MTSLSRHCGSFAAIGTLAALGILAGAAQAQVASHIYELNGSLADSLGGPSLTSNGGTLGPTGLTFGINEGPSLTGGIDAADYSIELYFSFTDTVGYRKIIDFKNRTVDAGLYNESTKFDFFPAQESGTGVFANNTLAHVVLTRNGGTNQVTGYVNGVQLISFTDGGSLAVFATDGSGNTIAQFLRDDGAQGSEASSGFVDFIRIYDNPLTAAEVTARFNATIVGAAAPEPGTLALLGTGALLTGAGVIRRRRQRKAS